MTTITQKLKLYSPSTWMAAGLFAFIFAAIVWATMTFYTLSPDTQTVDQLGNDWHGAIRRSCLALISGASPYHLAAFNPPWTFLILAPIAVLPARLSIGVMFALNFFAFGYAAHRYGAKPLVVIFFAISPLVIGNGWFGNIDWMIALGATLPPQIGIFLVLAKPQLGIGIALYWLIEAWRMGGIMQVAKVFGPVAGVTLISFVLYGLWPLYALEIARANWSADLFPTTVPLGIAMLVYAVRSRKPALAISASPFLAPYLSYFSWSIAVFGVLCYPTEAYWVLASTYVIWRGQIGNILMPFIIR